MKNRPAILRRIRSALRLASDPSAPKGESRSAARMAEKLRRKHKVTDDELRGIVMLENPGARLPITGGENLRKLCSDITKIRFPKVNLFVWTSRVDANSNVMEFFGDIAQVALAAELWKVLENEIRETWETMQRLKKTFQSTLVRDAFLGAPLPTDELSWFAGIFDGFEAEERLQGFDPRQHSEFKRVDAEDTRKLLPAAKKRRTLPRFNALALGPVFKPWTPPTIIDIKPKTMSVADWCEKNVCLPEFPPSSPEPPERDAYQLHNPSWQAGLSVGRKLAKRFPRKHD